MTILDLDSLSKHDLIVQYIIECRGQGVFLPYEDYDVIKGWLEQARDADSLLLVLSDLAPTYFAKSAEKTVLPTLKGLNKRVLKQLRSQNMRT